MITLKRVEEVKSLDYAEIIRRSPVAEAGNALDLLIAAIKSSKFSYIGYINDEIACIYGVNPPSLISDRAYMWLLTTDVVDQNKFSFVRHSQLVVEHILKDFAEIVGDTHIKDNRAVRWIRWLGGTYNDYNGDLIPFRITRHSFERRRWQTL